MRVLVDSTQLRDLLAAGQWQQADQETGVVMLKIAPIASTGTSSGLIH